MSFHKCWNLALALLTYNDVLVYGQYKYLLICCLSISIDWIYNWQGKNLHLNLTIFLAFPYYSHSSAQSIHSRFLYTTQGDAEHAELQESVYTNDTQSCYQKKQFPSPNALTEILPRSHNLDSNTETELTCLVNGTLLSLFSWVKGPGFSSTLPLNAIKWWATHRICTQEHF